jgi:hypothetical protein
MTAALTAAVLVGGASTAEAVGAARRVANGEARTVRDALATLNLSPAQRARATAIAAAARPALRILARQRLADASALRTALAATPADPVIVGDAAIRLRADRQAARAELARVVEATRNLLTDAQRLRFDAYLDAAHALHRR